MLVPRTRRNQSMVRYAAPALRAAVSQAASSAASSAIKSALSSIDYSRVGSALRRLKNGYKAVPTESLIPRQGFMDSSSSAPVITSSRFISRSAKIVRGKGRGPTTVSHRELISGSISGSTTFLNQLSLPLNPGMSTTFPWLSTQASQYEEYRFRKLRFEYVPIAPTSTQGDVLLIPDYDSSNPPATSEVQAIDHRDAVLDSVWKPVVCSLSVPDMHALGPRKYVRIGATYGDIKTFDCGNFYISSNNETGSSTIGKLFVEYTVDLFTPVNPVNVATFTSTSLSYFGNGFNQTITSTVPTTLLFSATNVNALNVVNTSGSFVPPAGSYKIEYGGSFYDSVSENFVAEMQLLKNGSVVTTSTQPVAKGNEGASQQVYLSGVGIVSANGTDAFTVSVTLTGTGSLIAASNTTSVIFTIA